MENTFLIVITLISGFLVVYHHLLYPLIMHVVHKRLVGNPLHIKQRHYCKNTNDKTLPTIAIVIPAYNEAQWIAAKIRNLAALDYPSDRLKVYIVCDGCEDNTDNIAYKTVKEPECQHLSILVYPYIQNRGKVAVINSIMEHVTCDLVALSDVSALISVDALLVAAEHFKQADVGVVNSHYQLLKAGSEGEAAYWDYQCELKTCEAALGSTLGAHGAFYMFRRSLFKPLATDTINDDFILPMEIVAKGYRAEQDNRITALELEQADDSMDTQRRRRIGAGNLQQLIRLRRLLHPKFGGVAFTFCSGKALRVLMPFLMIIAFLGSVLLMLDFGIFAFLAAGQLLAYGLTAWYTFFKPSTAHRYIKTLAYLVCGHIANLMGSVRYLLGLEQGRWKSVHSKSPK